MARALMKDGWHVRAFTRDASSPKAEVLATLGAEIFQGDMNDRRSLKAAIGGAYGVFSVQNPMISGMEAEIKQGKLVGVVAQATDAQHLVYTSAGNGKPTGIGSWDAKLEVEAHLKVLKVPLTILRPMAFMELMTDKGYYPQVSTWHLMPKLMGVTRSVGWIAVEDVGAVAANVFAAPERFVGQDIKLASDVKSIEECREIYRGVMGKTLHASRCLSGCSSDLSGMIW